MLDLPFDCIAMAQVMHDTSGRWPTSAIPPGASWFDDPTPLAFDPEDTAR